MATRSPSALPIGLAAVLISILTGCGGGNDPRLANQQFVGKWVEQPPERLPNSPPEPERYRVLELKSDGSFTLTLMEKSGAPTTPAQEADGKWFIEGKSIKFETANNSIAKSVYVSALTQSLKIQLKSLGHAERDTIEFRDENQLRCKLVRE